MRRRRTALRLVFALGAATLLAGTLVGPDAPTEHGSLSAFLAR